MDASSCIYMYCNTERNIMKNQFGSHGFWELGENLCVYMFYVIFSLHYLFYVFRIPMQVICV